MGYHQARDPRFATTRDALRHFDRYLRAGARNPDSAVLVADADGCIIGYTLLTILSNPPVFELPRYGFVAEMCVDEAMRGKGIGRKLWEQAAEWFRQKGLSTVQLNVACVNEEGRRFWRHLGFREYLEVLWYDLPSTGGPAF